MNEFEQLHKSLVSRLRQIGCTDTAFTELADKAGVDRSTIRRIVAASPSNPTIGVLSRILDALNAQDSMPKNNVVTPPLSSRPKLSPSGAAQPFIEQGSGF